MEDKEQNIVAKENKNATNKINQQLVETTKTPKKRSWQAISLILLVVVLIGTIGFLVYQNMQLKKAHSETESGNESLNKTETHEAVATDLHNCRQFVYDFSSDEGDYTIYYEYDYSNESGLPNFIIWKDNYTGEKKKIFEDKETPAEPRFIPSAIETLTILEMSFADVAYYYVLDLIKGESTKIDLKTGYFDYERPIGWTGTNNRSILVKSTKYDENFGISDENADIYYWSAPYYDLQNKTYYKKSN